MSVPDRAIEEPDRDLCKEHWQYRPCRSCKRQAEVEKAESKKDE